MSSRTFDGYMDLQVYDSLDDFRRHIVKHDDVKELPNEVRDMNWEVQIRECRECGEEFETDHPARMYCENCANIEDKVNKSESVISRIRNKRIIRDCDTCGNKFILSAPAMKKCEECSPTGGKIARTGVTTP